MKERNHVTRAMVQWCVAVHTTFRLGSGFRVVLRRARRSWTWTWTWSTSNVSQALNLNLFLPLRVWVVWLGSLRVKLVTLSVAKAVIPIDMPRLGPIKGDLILVCHTKNR